MGEPVRYELDNVSEPVSVVTIRYYPLKTD